MPLSITAFLPCRKGSKRVPSKNIRPFSTYQFGLLEIKLTQLIKCDEIENIFLSSDDVSVLDYGNSLKSSKIILDHRASDLSADDTTTDRLIQYAANVIHGDVILWTHVTSPFTSNKLYTKMIRDYFDGIKNGYDSLMSVTPKYNFMCNSSGEPINYSREFIKWPNTQNLDPVYDINSACFLSSRKNYVELNDRIGHRPMLFKMSELEAFDIDWPHEFLVAEKLLDSNLVEV